MPQISIVIVNYNVRHFLELCLQSVRAASKNAEVEVLVVDNNSHDGSCEMVKRCFPEVTLIENKDNPGFGKANNQAIKLAKGEYVLLLNPDTIIGETTLYECAAFMASNARAGALGVHMVDGSGNYLRESKRALPTPMVSFYKIFGLASIFPHSKRFGQYHLGYLDKNGTHEVTVLSGAFMFMRKTVLDKIGLFDEAFFMYGEDIDLSYRVILGGYKNYYLGGTRIIHFKGESTKKGSLNYVVVFYKAMEIFARKHFTGHGASPMRLAIETAIWLRAVLAMLKRFVGFLLRPFSAVKKLFQAKRTKTDKIAIFATTQHYPQIAESILLENPLTTVAPMTTGMAQNDNPMQLVREVKPTTIVLCPHCTSHASIIDLTSKLHPFEGKIKILSTTGNVLVGSKMNG